jgi:hypothetical protein
VVRSFILPSARAAFRSLSFGTDVIRLMLLRKRLRRLTTGCDCEMLFEYVDDILVLDHRNKDAIRGIAEFYTAREVVSHWRSTQAWALTRNNSLMVKKWLNTGGRRHGRTQPGEIATRIGATSGSRHLYYWLILDSDILRQEAPSVDEHHYGEWKERGDPPNMPASRPGTIGNSLCFCFAFCLH